MGKDAWLEYDKYANELGNVRNPRKFNLIHNRQKLILDNLENDLKILDIGAGKKWIEGVIHNKYPNCRYRSLDIDRTLKHDFYHIDEVNEKFDVIIIFDVLEHLYKDDLKNYISKCYELLNDGGKVIISIPNIYYMGNIYNTTCHHVENYSFPDLYLFLRKEGFSSVDIFRLSPKIIQKNIKMPINTVKHLLRLLFVNMFDFSDYATDILLIGNKKNDK